MAVISPALIGATISIATGEEVEEDPGDGVMGLISSSSPAMPNPDSGLGFPRPRIAVIGCAGTERAALSFGRHSLPPLRSLRPRKGQCLNQRLHLGGTTFGSAVIGLPARKLFNSRLPASDKYASPSS